MASTIMHGRYYFDKEKKILMPDEDQKKINEMKRKMKMLDDAGIGVPLFLFNPSDNSYWIYTQYTDHSEELKEVTREYIESTYPTVNCDKMHDVKR